MNIPEELVKENLDPFAESSVIEFLTSGTFLLSMAVFVGAWALGLATVPFRTSLLQIDAGALWSTVIIVFLGATIFAAFPLVIYASFIQRERRYALGDTLAELQHHGWMKLVGDMTQRYSEAFRPERYAVPLFLATLTAVVGSILVVFSNGFAVIESLATVGKITSVLAQISLAHPVAFGFLGAYFFSLQYLLRRYLARDLTPAVYMHLVVRTWIVMILTFVYTTIRNPVTGDGVPVWARDVVLVSFVGGVIPNIIWQSLRNRALLVLGNVGNGETLEMPFGKIQGLNNWQQARLLEAGVENAQNLAMADVVELMVTTRLGAVCLLDWIDQAMLYIHVGDEIEQYRSQGIRTASAYVLSFSASESNVLDNRGDAKPTTSGIGTSPDGSADPTVISTVISITNHPNFHRLRQLREAAKLQVAREYPQGVEHLASREDKGVDELPAHGTRGAASSANKEEDE
ncbi:MAG: hypothetical protein O7D33_00850 [Chloroflexi bacterium]|nr:hypothetical protein [Chloroflexota bacterium]